MTLLGTLESATIAHSASDQALWNQLQQSSRGYVVMMRHAEAPGMGDPSNFRLNDCSTQRNLSVEGRSQAAKIGQEFQRRKVRVAKVLSSQWCRCLETAKLLRLAPVEPFSALNSFFQHPQADRRQTSAVQQFILHQQHTSGITILVTHQVNITALTDVVPRSGEIVVLQASGNTVKVLGRLQPP